MKLSIILPIYNVAKYLDFALNSIYKQNIPPNDFEIIAVNDGSTDDSHIILKKWETLHNNLKVFNQKNQGVSIARNFGLEKSKGDYILFMDPDDALVPYSLIELIEISENENADILSGEFIQKDDMKFENETVMNYIQKNNNVYIKINGTIYLLNDFDSHYPTIWRYLFKREFLINHKLKFENYIKFAEDCLFIVTALLKAKIILKTNVIFYIYRLRNNSAVTSINIEKIKDLGYVIKKLEQLRDNTKERTVNRKLNNCIYEQFSLFIWYSCHHNNIFLKRKEILKIFKKAPYYTTNFKQRIIATIFNISPPIYLRIKRFLSSKRYF